MYRSLAASRMILKIYIDVAGNHAGNIHMFESTGAGTLQILIDKLNSLSTKSLLENYINNGAGEKDEGSNHDG